MLPLGSPICPPTPPGCAPASRRSRHISSATTRPNSWLLNHRWMRTQGSSLRQVADRRRLLGHSRQGRRASPCTRCSAAPRRRDHAVSCDFAGSRPRPWHKDRRLPCRRLLASSNSRSAATPDDGHRTHSRLRAMLGAGRHTGRGCQYRLDPGRRGARGARRARYRCVYRAALRDLRGMPVDPPPHCASVRAGRGDHRTSAPWCGGTPITPWTSSTSRSASSAV